MIRVMFPSLGIFFATEASRAFVVAMLLFSAGLAWAWRNHKRREAQLRREEVEDTVAIAMSSVTFLVVTFAVFKAFNPPEEESEVVEQKNGYQLSHSVQRGDILPVILKRSISSIGWVLRQTTNLFSLVAGDTFGKTDEEIAHATLSTAITLVVGCIVVLLILICCPHFCRRCEVQSPFFGGGNGVQGQAPALLMTETPHSNLTPEVDQLITEDVQRESSKSNSATLSLSLALGERGIEREDEENAADADVQVSGGSILSEQEELQAQIDDGHLQAGGQSKSKYEWHEVLVQSPPARNDGEPQLLPCQNDVASAAAATLVANTKKESTSPSESDAGQDREDDEEEKEWYILRRAE